MIRTWPTSASCSSREHPTEGTLLDLKPANTLSSGAREDWLPAPHLGEQTGDRSCPRRDYSAAQIAALIDSGAARQHRGNPEKGQPLIPLLCQASLHSPIPHFADLSGVPDVRTQAIRQPSNASAAASTRLLVTLNRPEVLNAMNGEMGLAMQDILRGLHEDSDWVRCVVLTGAGRAFCAGGDLKIRNNQTVREWTQWHEISERNVELRMECPVPWIAAVNGACYAGGLEAALTCDFIYADTAGALCPDRMQDRHHARQHGAAKPGPGRGRTPSQGTDPVGPRVQRPGGLRLGHDQRSMRTGHGA